MEFAIGAVLGNIFPGYGDEVGALMTGPDATADTLEDLVLGEKNQGCAR
jgi:hypothetical protein